MAAELRTYEPREVSTGETPQWTKSFDDYPASEGWALSYYFRGPGAGFDVAATADGDDFTIAVPAAATADLTPGTYFWQAWVSKADEKYQVGEGSVTVKEGFAAVTTETSVDKRSQAKRILDAIDATLEGRATTDQQQYQISGGGGYRMLMKIPVGELITLRKYYAGIYSEELRQARARRGGNLFKTVKVRFTIPK
jgi:hypothetical protein